MPGSIPENIDAKRTRGITKKRVSNQKLRSELGYRFKYPTFREGYTAAIEELVRAGGLPAKGQ